MTLHKRWFTTMKQDKNIPNISVIMPVYNTKEKYLREAIESILKQSYIDFEFIIVDDCSDEYIAKIILSYKDNRIKYFRLSANQGAALARNFAISKAQGKYLAFMDSDDISLPERFSKQVKFFEEHPEIGCIGTKVKIIGNDREGAKFPTPTEHPEIESFMIFNGCVFCQSSVMLQKEILDKNNIQYKNQYVPAEDYALWLDLVGKTKFAVLKEKLVFYRSHSENISHQQKILQQQKCTEAQFFYLKKYCNIKKLNKDIWFRFYRGIALTPKEFIYLNNNLIEIIKTLYAKSYKEKTIYALFQKKFKKMFYRSHGISVQWKLLTSPLNKTLKIPLYWRLFCFITRGFF